VAKNSDEERELTMKGGKTTHTSTFVYGLRSRFRTYNWKKDYFFQGHRRKYQREGGRKMGSGGKEGPGTAMGRVT